ncbi:hypothetical protein [Alkaliphilus metalliredigens]|uniref:hypothetical protein n=1 Tax=Alkaliphilus metalliredigens TaxID=208226 RepID=UPI001F60560D|nr:hypothetical protein [Alkaliphilus metalliredigens]
MDEIFGSEDFANCYELYLQKRYNGEKEACEQYNEPEIIEIPEGEDISVYLQMEQMKYQNVDEIIRYLYDSNKKIMRNAISAISRYVYIGNESAYKGLVKYYMSLGPAETLEDVYIRKEIIEILSSKESEKSTIDAYVNELARTPSNNTTRQLYTEILKRLSRCPCEMVQEPLLELLRGIKYSYKIKNRIMEVAGVKGTNEYY